MSTQRFVAGAILTLLCASCGGGSGDTTVTTATTTTAPATTTTTEASFSVSSDDGRLTVTVPVSSAPSDPGITIGLLDPAAFPAGLEGLPSEAALLGYDLGPDGHVFAAPVTVTLAIDATEFPDLASNEVPVVVLFTTTPEGGFAPLGALEVTRRGAEVLVSGTTTHFSPVIAARESTSVIVTVSAEELENTATASTRSLDGILELMAQTPGVIPVVAGLHDASGTPISGVESTYLVDGLPFTATSNFLTITCDAIAEVEVLKVSNSAQFGSDPIAGVVNLIVTGGLFQSVEPFDISLALSGRARCLDPAGSILLTELSGLELTTDHPAGEVFIHDENFLGGLSALLARLEEQSRFVGLYGGLICDNNGNGQVDMTDTMFPGYPLTSVGNRYEFVGPLFGYADYFVYFFDETLYSGAPAGASWTVEQGLGAYESMFSGAGRFASSIGVVEVGGSPFVYNVGPAEGSLAVPGASIGMFDSLRLRF